MTLTALIGIGITSFLLLYFSFSLDKKEHWLLQLLVSFFVLGLLVIAGKVALDDKDTCDIVKLNQTVVDNTTTYNYGEFCVENTHNSTLHYYKTIVWFFRCYVGYILMYFLYRVWIRKKLLDMKMFNRWRGSGK